MAQVITHSRHGATPYAHHTARESSPQVLLAALISQDDCDDCCPSDGDGGRRRCMCWGLGSFTVFIVLFAMSWDTLEPTEYGLVQNGFTGYVDLRPEAVYGGGRYFVWLVRHAAMMFAFFLGAIALLPLLAPLVLCLTHTPGGLCACVLAAALLLAVSEQPAQPRVRQLRPPPAHPRAHRTRS